jgi:glycosidase
MPSSRSCHNTRRLVCWLIRIPTAERNPEIIRANWEAVAVNASWHSFCSSTISTTRVTSRTFEYDNRPSRNRSATVGMPRKALATRTCSRATPGVIEQHHDSQCAKDLKSLQYRIAPIASNSPSSSNNV